MKNKTWILLAAGAAWVVRAVIGLNDPDYWNPRTPLDYAAVIGTSVALILTAVGVWEFYRYHPAPSSRAQKVWQWSVIAICISAFTVGINNFIEDALHIKSLGIVWVVGNLVLTVGLLIAGLSALWVKGFSRWVGILLLIAALGLVFTETNGQFATGAVLVALSFVGDRR